MGQRADERWPPAQTRQEFLEQVKAGNASPNCQGWRARLAMAERLLCEAEEALATPPRDAAKGHARVRGALAEVRAMLDERP